MSKPLVIVESPTKVKTISKILGTEYNVKSSVGHIRDLPRNSKSIPNQYMNGNILWGAVKPGNFENIYVVPEDRRKIVNELKKLAKDAPDVYLATDDDREGEAIAYHLKEILNLKFEPKRIKFNEITESAVKKAIDNPETINIGKFKSYEARRTLDRMIGYEISPKVRDLGGAFISTGRVQGPAIRLIVEREEERIKFVKSRYFDISSICNSGGYQFEATVKKINSLKVASSSDFNNKGERISAERYYLEQSQIDNLKSKLSNLDSKVSKIKSTPRTSRPPKPFKTTTLQSAARSALGFQPGKTMGIAQKLYQEGLITYMRTDSIRLSDVAINASRKYIAENFSDQYLPENPNLYGDNQNAQAAHEAIRPSGEIFTTPQQLENKYNSDTDEFKLYSLIFNTTIASQMSDANGYTKTIEIQISDEEFGLIILGISGTTWEFGGYRDQLKYDNDLSQELPDLIEGQNLTIERCEIEEKFTSPPNRYSSTSLINKMEELGIGRPSTYVSIIDSITSVFINSESNLKPRALAMALINNFMKPFFNQYIDFEFSKEMEDELDKILDSSNPEDSKINFLEKSYESITFHINEYGTQDPAVLTTVNLPFESRYVIKTGRIVEKTPYPYLLRDDGFKVGLPPDITIEELTKNYIDELEVQQEKSLKKERSVGDCPECKTEIYIKLGPNGSFYLQHGEKTKGIKQSKCKYKNLIGPIFEDEDPNNLSIEDSINRFSLSTKNPRLVTTSGEWSYLTAVGPYGGYAIKQRDRKVFNLEHLNSLNKEELIEILDDEKYKNISNYLGGENLKISKTQSKDEIINSIAEHYKLEEKRIKTLNKETLVLLSKALEIVFYRGRFRMKAEDATKQNLINKILIDKKNKPLETPRHALTITSEEILNLFGDLEN